MTDFINLRVNILRLVFGTALWSTLAGCTGPLIYRPAKKTTPLIAPAAVTNSNLPPEPDIKSNNATLAGIDTTGTGIRDDVYIWIYRNYTSAKKNKTITKMAKALQVVIVTPAKTTEDARKLKQSLDDALLLLKGVPGLGANDADKLDLYLYDLTVNTPERLKSYLHYNLLLGDKK